jgi:2-deoxy-D-gluconate 3-dehydrogenase
MSPLKYDLENKVYIITGGSRGIGFEMAKLLLEQKAKVIICGRKQQGLDSASEQLNAGENLLAVQAHIAKTQEVEKLFDQTLEAFGQLDGLINNVGMNIITGAVDADPALWNKIIDSNLTGTFLCSRKAGQIMRGQQKGKIVSISSIAARRSAPAMGIYGIAKAGIEMLRSMPSRHAWFEPHSVKPSGQIKIYMTQSSKRSPWEESLNPLILPTRCFFCARKDRIL